MPEPSLPALQRWMQAVVVHPGTIEQALDCEAARAEWPAERLGEVILPSRTLTPAERLSIYHGMYLLRMHDALEYDYPGLAHFLGHERFHALVREYVQAHPSRSHTLNRLGDHLPGFLRDADVPRREFCCDLARLELAITEAFDAPETKALDESAIAAVPQDAWESARLRPVAALRLLSFRYPVSDYLASLRDEEHRHPQLKQRRTWVAIYRRDYGVRRLELARPAHDLLADLAAGHTLGEAIAAALKRPARPRPEPELLFRWFREWIADGVFHAVELHDPA